MLGLHVDHHMGNGVDWAASAKKHGYPTGDTPRLGAIVSMSGGVLGASAGPYGHVAVVEQMIRMVVSGCLSQAPDSLIRMVLLLSISIPKRP